MEKDFFHASSEARTRTSGWKLQGEIFQLQVKKLEEVALSQVLGSRIPGC